MPVLTGSALADASGTALEDASAVLLGEPDVTVRVAYGGFLLAQNEGDFWEQLNAFLRKIQSAIDLGEGFVSAIVLANVLAAIEDLIEAVDGVQASVNTANQRIWYISDDGTNSLQDVRDDIAAIDPGGLTTEEHDHLVGLVNVNTEQLVGDIWGYTIAVDDLRQTLGGLGASQVLENLWYAALVQTGFNGIRAAHNPWFAYIAYSPSDAAGAFGDYLSGSDPTFLPSLDLTLVVEGDTVWTYLTREYPAWTWTRKGPGDDDDGSQVWLGTDGIDTVAGWRCLLTDADLAGIWREQEIPDPAAMDLPPVWPGSANVTLGEPVALVDQLNLVGTMDGVLVNVTTPPTKTGVRSVGGALYDYNVGEIAFESDGGEIEPWQYLGFRSALFVPKTMTSAAGARFRVLAGAAGTVTPWVRS